jgi:hypothetical protein
MMVAVRTSETSVDNYFTRHYIPEDNSGHHTSRRENLKSDMKEEYPKKSSLAASSIVRQDFDIWNTGFSGSIPDRDILVYSVGLDILFWALWHADSQSKILSKSQLQK